MPLQRKYIFIFYRENRVFLLDRNPVQSSTSLCCGYLVMCLVLPPHGGQVACIVFTVEPATKPV